MSKIFCQKRKRFLAFIQTQQQSEIQRVRNKFYLCVVIWYIYVLQMLRWFILVHAKSIRKMKLRRTRSNVVVFVVGMRCDVMPTHWFTSAINKLFSVHSLCVELQYSLIKCWWWWWCNIVCTFCMNERTNIYKKGTLIFIFSFIFMAIFFSLWSSACYSFLRIFWCDGGKELFFVSLNFIFFFTCFIISVVCQHKII